MDFVSLNFYIFLAIAVIVYYIVPLRFRWVVLLVANFYFFHAATTYRRELIVFVGIIVVSWLLGLAQEKLRAAQSSASSITRDTKSITGLIKSPSVKFRQIFLGLSIAAVLVPLIFTKYQFLLYGIESLLHKQHWGVLVSIGLSFFSLQIVAYLVDVYKGKVPAQHNLFKYALFVSFFPQMIQGPIPRYEILEPQLVTGHRFDEEKFTKGFMLILWGFFLKLVIADKASVIVDTVFESYTAYQGGYVLVAGILYSIQLYADFLACVTLAQGISQLFGIELSENFNHPYFSTSIAEFWRRWHISLSQWLRDYIYIPLGGNRKGKLRKYINLIITFVVSGIWHGTGFKYIFWGLMHAAYQIVGAITQKPRERFWTFAGLPKGRRIRTYISRIFAFFCVMAAWVVFRAETLQQGLFMLKSMFTVYNPWIFFNDSLFGLGLEWKECVVLISAVLLLIHISRLQENGMEIRNRILAQPIVCRWLLYFTVITVIILFGTYGYGFNAADFIYGNF